jgi:hypothetical protein
MGHELQRQGPQRQHLHPRPVRQFPTCQLLVMAEGGDERAINHPLGHQRCPVAGGVEAGRHLQHPGQPIEQHLMQRIGAQPQPTVLQPMGTTGQPQEAQARAQPPAAHLAGPAFGLEAELLGQIPVAAAHRGLVHREGAGGTHLATAHLHQIQHVQVHQHVGRPVGLAPPPRRRHNSSRTLEGHSSAAAERGKQPCAFPLPVHPSPCEEPSPLKPPASTVPAAPVGWGLLPPAASAYTLQEWSPCAVTC